MNAATNGAHSDETKAAVLAALLAGQSVSAVAEQYRISRETIRRWRKAAGLAGDEALVDHQKRGDIGTLLLSYLTETLTTLCVQQRHFRKAEWLDAQSASELAVLHGVSVDKAVRLLEALQQPDEPGAGGSSPADVAN